MKKRNAKKSAADFIRTIRRHWAIKPVTRVHDNVKKEKKKRRQGEKKLEQED